MTAAAITSTAETSRRPVPGEAGGTGEAPQAPTLGTHRGELFPSSSEAFMRTQGRTSTAKEVAVAALRPREDA